MGLAKKLQIGIKVHSVNIDLRPFLIDAFRKECFHYIEIFIVPNSADYLKTWQSSGIPCFLHAPHSYSNLNLSIAAQKNGNDSLLKEVDIYRNSLHPKRIIFHPGIKGTILETIEQINFFKRIYPEIFEVALIENKPKIALQGEVCIGSSPDEIKTIMDKTGIGFCLDIGHAIYYSAWANMDYMTVLSEFLRLGPFMFHLSDGVKISQTDIHLNFGKGDFDLKKILHKIPADTYLTIETDHKANPILIKNDIQFLNKLC